MKTIRIFPDTGAPLEFTFRGEVRPFVLVEPKYVHVKWEDRSLSGVQQVTLRNQSGRTVSFGTWQVTPDKDPFVTLTGSPARLDPGAMATLAFRIDALRLPKKEFRLATIRGVTDIPSKSEAAGAAGRYPVLIYVSILPE